MALYFAACTKGDDALTCELAGVLLPQCIGNVGRVGDADKILGLGGVPGRTFFTRF